jgi:hypothetical protein
MQIFFEKSDKVNERRRQITVEHTFKILSCKKNHSTNHFHQMTLVGGNIPKVHKTAPYLFPGSVSVAVHKFINAPRCIY